MHPIHIGVGALVLASGLSAIFSVSGYGSFWGTSQVLAPAFVSVAALAVVYFLVSNTFLKKDISTSVLLLAISSALALAYGILQMFGLHIILFSFAQNNSFNTIGSLGSLGFFAAVLLPLWILFAMSTKSWRRLLYVANIVLTLVVLVAVNYHFVWMVSFLVAVFLIVLWIIKRDVLDTRWIFLPAFFFILSLFFLIVPMQVAWSPQHPVEVSLSQKANMEIGFRSFKSLEFLGVGPTNFGYGFAKYKNPDFNQSPLWNVNFTSGASKVLTALVELGIVGLIILIISMALPVFYGFKYLLGKQTKQEPGMAHLSLGLLAVLACQTFGYFLYNGNISLDFIYLLTMASLVVFVAPDSKEYVLKSSSWVTGLTVFMSVAVFMFYAGVLFTEGQRYVADMQYRKGLALYGQNKKDESLQYLKRATKLGHSDLYYNQLALFSLARVEDYLSGLVKEAPEKQKQALESLILDAVDSSNLSVALNPQNYENWSTRAYMCQNLLGLAAEAPGCAIQSYERAIALNPNSAYLFLQQGNIYLSQAVGAQVQPQKDELLAKAVEKFNMALSLKTNYTVGYLQLSVALGLQQKPQESLTVLQNAEKYSARDAALSLQVGLAYYQLKNWPKAQENFQRALISIPKYANALYFSGLAYEKQGQKDNALAQFSKILELNANKEYIQNIVNNIKTGKPALEGLAVNPPAPVDSPASPSVDSSITK